MTSSLVPNPSRLTAVRGPLSLGLLALVLTGCEIPNYRGPQIQEPPTGFFINPEAVLDRELFPDKEITYRDAWVNTSWGEVSTIHITGHPGTVMRADVQEALTLAELATTEPVTFSGLREFTVDGRTAWGWDERLQTPALGIDWVAFRMVVPYDTVSFSIELFSGDPTFKGVPDTLSAIASTFAVGKTKWNLPVLLGIGALLIFLISRVQKRNRARQLQMQSIKFVEVKKKKEDEEEKGKTEDGVPEGTTVGGEGIAEGRKEEPDLGAEPPPKGGSGGS